MSDSNVNDTLRALIASDYTILKIMNYVQRDFTTIVERLNSHYDGKVQFALPEGGVAHFKFFVERKWAYLGIKALTGKLEDYDFRWGFQFTLSSGKHNEVVKGLAFQRILLQVDSLQGCKSASVGNVVPLMAPDSSEIDTECEHLTAELERELKIWPSVKDKSYPDHHYVSVRWSNDTGFGILVNQERFLTLEPAVWKIFDAGKINFSINMIDGVASIGNKEENSSKISKLHEHTQEQRMKEDAKSAVIFNIPTSITQEALAAAVAAAYESLWELDAEFVKRRGITIPPRFDTGNLHFDLYLGNTKKGDHNMMAFFNVHDESVFDVPEHYFAMGLQDGRGNVAKLAKKLHKTKSQPAFVAPSTAKGKGKGKGKANGKKKSSLDASAPTSPAKRSRKEAMHSDEDDVDENDVVDVDGDGIEDFGQASRLDDSPKATQSDSLEYLMKEFKAFQANTPVTIEQVKLVVSTAMKPLENSIEQISTYIEEMTKTQIAAREAFLKLLADTKVKLADTTVSESAKSAMVGQLEAMPELKEADKVALTAIMNAALKTQAEERAASNVEVLEKMSSAMLGQQDMLIQSQTDALEKIKSLPGANVTKKLEMGSADEGMPDTPPGADGNGGGPSVLTSEAL
jgi:hypothetical protein